MSKRDLKLQKHGISRNRYRELKAFCEQYPEWKQEIGNNCYVSGIQYTDMPKNPNMGGSDPTSENAIKLERYLSNCNLIESAAKEAGGEFWEFIIKAVCYEVPISYLKTIERLYLEQSAFYERRRYFFYLLDKMKNA